MVLAHFKAIALALPRDDAFSSPGTLFQTLAIVLAAMFGYPGTGGRISLDVSDRVCLIHVLSFNRRHPRGSIDSLDFQTVTAIMVTTASFRHFN